MRVVWRASSRFWIERLWSSIAERGLSFASMPGDAVAPVERARLLAKALLSGQGEASGAALSRELQRALEALTEQQRLDFMRSLAEGFTPESAALRAAAEAYLSDPSAATASRLTEAAEPPRQELLRRLNMAPDGTATLAALRRELLAALREEPALQPLEADLRHLLASWFNRGFLELRRIDWNTPASILERLIVYEAVHAIQGWDDLRRRLAPDRRCFAFFHPALAGEPLIFVEVALVDGLATAVRPLLAPDMDEASASRREAEANTAIFYSISNCQEGLRGISFGNLLIKQVVERLRAELPKLTRFATLSPVPGFRRWLDARLQETDTAWLRPEERAQLVAASSHEGTEPTDTALLRVLLEQPEWWTQPTLAEALRMPLLRAAARYLTTAPGARTAIDPVARFHLGNGAILERLNWLGNTDPRGLREAHGIMVNYLYDLGRIEANHEAFARNGRVSRSAAIEALLADPGLAPRRRTRAPAA